MKNKLLTILKIILIIAIFIYYTLTGDHDALLKVLCEGYSSIVAPVGYLK